MLYRPTEFTVNQIIDTLIQKHPVLASRARKAADILLNGQFYFDDKRNVWICHSSKDVRHTYAVNHTCSCPDFACKRSDAVHEQYGKAPVIRGRKYCKHRIAMLVYKEILEYHLNQSLIGTLDISMNWEHARSNAGALLLLDNNTGNICAFASRRDRIPSIVCASRWAGPDLQPHSGLQRLKFRTNSDIARFARWCASVPSSTYQPGTIDYATASQDPEEVFNEMVAAGYSHFIAFQAAERLGY